MTELDEKLIEARKWLGKRWLLAEPVSRHKPPVHNRWQPDKASELSMLLRKQAG